MPQKACERYIFHVMAYSIFFEITHFIFGSFSVLQLTACIFFRNTPLFYVCFFRNASFSLSDSENGKNGAFQKK